MGFFGIGEWYRDKVPLKSISLSEFIRVFKENNKLQQIVLSIKDIDRDRNGYVTTTEIDDILKYHYPKELGDKNLLRILSKFQSISNRILVDYKQLNQWIYALVHKEEATLQISQVTSKDETVSQTQRTNSSAIANKLFVQQLQTQKLMKLHDQIPKSSVHKEMSWVGTAYAEPSKEKSCLSQTRLKILGSQRNTTLQA